MPPQPTLKIAEIFASIQGEGLRLGLPAFFVRLAGCNLRCSFCDTKPARRGGRPMTPEAVLSVLTRKLGARPADWICLTGGEPFVQDLDWLVRLFHDHGFRIQVETNGTLYRDIGIDWVTVSPKPSHYRVAPEISPFAREVKLVVSREMTLPVLRRVRSEFPPEVPIFLQPESNLGRSRIRAAKLFDRAFKERFPDIRLGVQLHKIYRLP